MNKNVPLIVFGYAFPHRKTYDFVSMLFARGFRNLAIIGAPKRHLAGGEALDQTDITKNISYCVKSLCSSLSIQFTECAHDDVGVIDNIRVRANAKIAIISGARIINKEVIELFEDGIVNFHPGKIPETSGLDSFFYTIEKNCSPGVTVHLINEKVDAGKQIFFEKLAVKENESIEDVRANLYGTQLQAFRKYLDFYFGRDIRYPDIDRPKKNPPLTKTKKYELTAQYDFWLDSQLKLQAFTEMEFFDLCKKGDCEKVELLINKNSYLLHHKSTEGWSAIIIAAFWQRLSLVELLLNLGANPNDKGKNGTTVLMYAKTKILSHNVPDFTLLELVLRFGASIEQKDHFNKTIFDYLDRENDLNLAVTNFLKSY